MATVVDLGMEMGKVSPERFLTKICMVSSGSAEGAREEVEETLEMLLERMMAVGVRVSVVIAVMWKLLRLCGVI